MSGALVGFRTGGVHKLMRLHGERSCEQVLRELRAFLHGTDDARLAAYTERLQMVGASAGPYPSPAVREQVEDFLGAQHGETCVARAWSEVFAALPDMEAWHIRFPFLPEAVLPHCGDVPWGFVVDLDAGQLQIFVNRHNRFHWRDFGPGLPAFCSMAIDHVRELSAADIGVLHDVMHAHSYSDGLDPVLPASDGISDCFHYAGQWRARVQLSTGRVRLLLERERLRATVSQVGELRLDAPGYGAFLCQALDPEVLRLALTIYGPGVSVTQVAAVSGSLPSLPFLPEQSALPLLDLGLRPTSGLSLALGAGYFDGLKARLMAAGMTNQGWKFLVKQDGAVLRFILDFFPPSVRNLGEFAHFINLIASALQADLLKLARCQPGLRGVARILERGLGKISATREENARIFIRALMRADLSAEEADNLGHEAQDVSDFVHAQHQVLGGATVTWHSLCRRSTDWHRAVLVRIEPARDVHWQALLPVYAAGDYLAVELDTGSLLAEEGLEQRHCVGNYANACASGSCRVFSLRRQGKRTATLELRRERDGTWVLAQLRGKANSVIRDEQLLAAAAQVAAAYAHRARVQ